MRSGKWSIVVQSLPRPSGWGCGCQLAHLPYNFYSTKKLLASLLAMLPDLVQTCVHEIVLKEGHETGRSALGWRWGDVIDTDLCPCARLCTCRKHARTARRAPFRCCLSPHSLRVARTVVSSHPVSLTVPEPWPRSRLTHRKPPCALVRYCDRQRSCPHVGHLICLSSSRLASPPCLLQTRDAYGFVTVPKWA